MKTRFLFSCLLLSASVWAETLTVTPHSVVRLTVSNREPNVIAVMNDRIVEANSASGKLADKKATDSGALIFTTEETVPFSLYIETEKGFGFTVNAIPVKKSQGITSLLNQWVLQHELFRGLTCYIVERGNTSDAKQFLHQIAEKATDYREVVMTIAEQLRQEGEKQGIEKGIHLGEQRGIAKGIEKGRQETARTIARQLLANGVDRALVKMSTGLSDAEINALMD